MTRISDMTPLNSLPASGARVPVVKDGIQANYNYDIAAKMAALDANAAALAAADVALTAADAARPTSADLAASTGLSLIGTPFGITADAFAKALGQTPQRGSKSFAVDRLRAYQMAEAISNPSTTPMVGFAKVGSTNGGYGKVENQTYDPDGDSVSTLYSVPIVRFVTNGSDDVNVIGSFRWAVAQIISSTGGYIIAHPRGRITTTLSSPIYLPSNCTIAAPGRNWTIRTSLSQGALRFYNGTDAAYGQNIILWAVKLKCEGGGNNVNYDLRPGEVDILAAVPSNGSNKIWVHECTISGATDGAFDIAGGALPGSNSYYTISNCVFRNTDKVMAVGLTGYTLSDAAKIFVTLCNNHFDGCSERQPLCSGLAYIHAFNNVHDNTPHYRDYTEGTSVSSVGAGDSRTGGRLLVENSIIRIGTTTAGMAGNTHQGYAANSGLGGAFKVLNTYKDAAVLNTVDYLPNSVGALPGGYAYTATDVLTDTSTAAKTIINAAGAGRTNWPEGIYAPIDTTTGDTLGLHANGESVVYHEGYFWRRTTDEDELEQPIETDALNIARGSTLTVASGAITLLDDRVFAIAGEGGVADDLTTVNLTTDTNYTPITGGLIFIRPSSSTVPITLKSGGNISTQHNIVLDNASQWACLLWNGTNAWDVLFEPTRLLAKFDHFADVGNGTTVETDLYSDSIVANRLNTNGDKLKAEYGGIFVAHATATRQLKLYFGGTAIFDSGASATTTAETWTVAATIIRVSASVVRYKIDFSATTSTGTGMPGITKVGELTGLTLSNANILKITGTAAAAGAATNDIVAKLGTVIFVPAA